MHCVKEFNNYYQSDSLDHVLDMAADGANCGQLLSVAPPLIHTKLRNNRRDSNKQDTKTMIF